MSYFERLNLENRMKFLMYNVKFSAVLSFGTLNKNIQ